VAAHTVYKLYRIEGEGRVEVSAHKTLGEGFSAGQDAVHAGPESEGALYLKGLNGDIRVARFGFSRLQGKAETGFVSIGALAGIGADG
jgi:hypothetical protein